VHRRVVGAGFGIIDREFLTVQLLADLRGAVVQRGDVSVLLDADVLVAAKKKRPVRSAL